jgi:hypothetical protein
VSGRAIWTELELETHAMVLYESGLVLCFALPAV